MDKLIIGIIAAVCGIIVGVIVGIIYRKKFVESVIGSREEQAKHILEDAINTAEARKKEALIEAKEEIFKAKSEADAEIKDRRREVSRLEHRIAAKEEAIDNKTAALEKREEQLNQKHQSVDALRTKIQETLDQHLVALERISGLTTAEAKEELLTKVERELAHETAMKLSEHEARFKDEAEARAKDILSLAIQRCAADHVGDVTISVVSLPSEDMKGRIIGREGRNIRSIETLIGVELIIDDTPEVITISGFDPVRREIARIALEKLIADGRIHPARIEEMVDKARREVENSIKHAGEAAVFETGVHGINGELVKLLGRLKYRTSYGQNALRHSVEVSLLSGVIAEELGVDSTLAKRAGLLHDIGKALTAEAEGSHVQLGVDVARKYKEGREVIHAIEAHHNDVEPHSIVALIVQAADAISAARPGARREDVENYIKRLQKLEEIAGEFSGVEKTFAIQAGREVRVMVSPDVIDDDHMKLLARDIAKKIESELEYPGQIKVHVIRENRIVEYAK